MTVRERTASAETSVSESPTSDNRLDTSIRSTSSASQAFNSQIETGGTTAPRRNSLAVQLQVDPNGCLSGTQTPQTLSGWNP